MARGSCWRPPCGPRRSCAIIHEIAGALPDVLRAVSKPDHTAADPAFDERTRYYAHGAGPSRWLLVVVSYEQVPARIVSAFANRKDPRSWSA